MAENATLTEVALSTGVDRAGEPAAVAVEWAGRVRGYLHAPRMADQEGGREIDERPVRFTITGAAAVPIGDLLVSGADGKAAEITLEDDVTGSEEIYTLKGVARYQVGSVADSVRLELRKGRVQ